MIMALEDSTADNVIKASEFKAKCLKLMDAISETGDELIITKNGKPVARLVPYVKPMSLFGLFKDDIRIVGDIMEPLDVEWEALKDTNKEGGD